jgi:hypothetical protein
MMFGIEAEAHPFRRSTLRAGLNRVAGTNTQLICPMQGEMVNLQKANLSKSQSIDQKALFLVFGKLTFWKLTISPNIVSTESQ